MASNITPKKAPALGIPKSSETCQVSVINTTTDITAPPYYLVEPHIKGHEWMNLPTVAFLIKHNKSGKQLLFDAGARKDWWNSVPAIAELAGNHVPGFRVTKDTIDVLSEGNVKPEDLDTFILSHWHFDHCGNPAALPKSVKMVVGPGFKETFMPGYPTKETSPYWEADFEGRDVVEISFSDALKIGQFQAHDYFGDGSLFILNVPGHATGHISGLVRTTPDTFVLMGGDVCHFTGALRPNEYTPMPEQIPDTSHLDPRISRPCPCSAFTISHPDQNNSRTTPFYKPSTHAASFYADPPLAQKSINALAEFDADPNILISIAHDPTALDVFTFFPHGTMNDWQKKGWKQAMEWGFVNELPYNGKTVRPVFVDGLYREGKRIKDMSGNAL